MSLKIKTLRKIVDLKCSLLKLRRQDSYRILGDTNDNSLIAITFNHTFSPYSWYYKFIVLHVDYVNLKGEWFDYFILDFGIFGFWFGIWIRLWKRAKRYEDC